MLTNLEWLPRLKRSQVSVAFGSIVVLCACLGYFLSGFNPLVFALWLFGLAICGEGLFAEKTPFVTDFSRRDAMVLIALVALALPCYAWSVYSVPFQLNSDELVLIRVERNIVEHRLLDVFGLSNYFGFTNFPFVLQGWLAYLLGGVDLYRLRLLHALDAVAIIACSFVFFRVLGLRLVLAMVATVALGANHALLAISRMASRTNGGLLAEVLALTFLFDGIKRRCPFTTYLGGLFTGLCFYVYYSARLVLPVWLAFLLVLFLFRRKDFPSRQLLELTACFVLGFSLSTLPIITANLKDNNAFIKSLDYQRHQCLLYTEGRLTVMHNFEKKTPEEGVMQNVMNGLTVFNNNVQDQGNIYPNPHHGFADPLSGLLVWLGLIFVLVYKSSELAVLLVVSGLFVELSIITLVIANAPNYTRLFVTLPFVGYLVAQAIDAISSFVRRLVGSKKVKLGKTAYTLSLLSLIFAVATWNYTIFRDFVDFGLVHGDDIGGTARYIEARKDQPNHLFILAASPNYQYYGWESLDVWNERASICLTPQQQFMVFSPDDLGNIKVVPPFSIFMNGKLWAERKEQLSRMYPHLVVHKIFDDRHLVAIEDASGPPDSASVHDAYRRWRDYLHKLDWLRDQSRYKDVCVGCLDALKSPQALANGSYFKSQILFNLGKAYSELKDYSNAEVNLLETFDLREKQAGDTYEAASVASYLADFYLSREMWGKAEEWYRRAAKITECAGDSDSTSWIADLPRIYRGIGRACWEQQKYSQAESYFQHAIDLCAPDEMDRKAEYANELALCRQDESDSRTSVREIEKEIAQIKESSKTSNRTASLYAKLGFEYMKCGVYAEADKAYSRAIAIKKRASAPDNRLAQMCAERGFVYLQQERYPEAEAAYADALTISTKDCKNRNFYERDRSFAQHEYLERQRKSVPILKIDPKIASLESAIAEALRTAKLDNRLAELFDELGSRYLKLERYGRAEEAFSNAICVTGDKSQPDNALAKMYGDRGSAYLKDGKYPEAEQDFSNALRLCSADYPGRSRFEQARSIAQSKP
jgi:tetratricopeptide (TPR) repeat protein